MIRAEHVGECSASPCANLPCLNHGSCRPTDDGHFKCLCVQGFIGECVGEWGVGGGDGDGVGDSDDGDGDYLVCGNGW